AGARLGVSVRLPWIVLTPRLDADYVHDVADRNQTVDVRLAGDPSTDDGDSIDASLRPTRTDPGYFVWTVGATAQWTKLLSAFVSYRTYAGADAPVTKELMWGLQFKATP
ncbi:MAG TPA: autotransporter domain-containing protein, partial [Pseudomonadales bacterium]|nr:autotransporter domain-containing protein [Pseudomonadales bacterium]